jgi:hypothetical protein
VAGVLFGTEVLVGSAFRVLAILNKYFNENI